MSGRKNQIPQYVLVSAGDMSANITSGSVNVQNLDNISFQCDLSGAGTANGTLSVQVSNTVGKSVNNWVTLTSQAITSGSPAPVFFDINQTSASAIRLVYTASSGAGSLTVTVSGKMI